MVIGLTGGIGSGKSTVAALLHARGARVVDTDAVAREVVEPGSPVLDAINYEFGSGVLTPDGRLDRQALARIVFADPRKRELLNQLTHPAIRTRTLDGTLRPLFEQWYPQLANDNAAGAAQAAA